jgi:hypothetical protein
LVVLGFGPSASIPILRIKRRTRLRSIGKPSSLSVLAIRRALKERPLGERRVDPPHRLEVVGPRA